MSKRDLDPEKVAIGARIRAARKAKGLKQAQLARAAGTGNVTLYRHERGTMRPALASIVKYAKQLDVTVEWLMHGGPGGPELQPPTQVVPRVKASDPNDVPLILAKFLAKGRVEVSDEEIAYLARQARAEPGLELDDFETLLLLRRVRQSGSVEDRKRLNAALDRQAAESGEHAFDLPAQTTPKPDSVRKIRPRPKR